VDIHRGLLRVYRALLPKIEASRHSSDVFEARLQKHRAHLRVYGALLWMFAGIKGSCTEDRGMATQFTCILGLFAET